MSSWDKKGVALAPETLVKLLLLSAFLIAAVSMIIMASNVFSEDGARKYSCWFTSSLKSSDGLFSKFFEGGCSPRVLEDPLDMKGVSLLLRDTWWMYGEGSADFALSDDIYHAASFELSEEVEVKVFLEYLMTHRKGRSSSIEKSDYNFLQQDAEGSTICFASEIRAGEDMKLEPGKYQLYFADSTGGIIETTFGDKLLIMEELKPRSYWDSENKFFCYSPLIEVIAEGKVLDELTWWGLVGGGWRG